MLYLSESDRHSLLQLARRAVVQAVSLCELPDQIPNSGIFAELCGVFVTLFVRNEMRGCIGVIEAKEPLGEAVTRCAASAALQDPRFTPINQEDLGDLGIEISLLSVLSPVRPDEIEIGKHGLIISQRDKRGLLLPQVAIEYHLNSEQFLAETCRKAGLPGNSWRDPASRIEAFTCEVFWDQGKHRENKNTCVSG